MTASLPWRDRQMQESIPAVTAIEEGMCIEFTYESKAGVCSSVNAFVDDYTYRQDPTDDHDEYPDTITAVEYTDGEGGTVETRWRLSPLVHEVERQTPVDDEFSRLGTLTGLEIH